MNLQAAKDITGSRVVVSLDDAKSFYSVEWSYLWECLRRYGFSPNCTNSSTRLPLPGSKSMVGFRTLPRYPGVSVRAAQYSLYCTHWPLAVAIRVHPNIRGLRME